jgi:hypothetical protein
LLLPLLLVALALAETFAFLRSSDRSSHKLDVEGDYVLAKAAVAKDLGSNDIIVFSPGWNDPLGRKTFGSLIKKEFAGWSDLARYDNVFEVAEDQRQLPELASFTEVGRTDYGRIRVRKLKNPQPYRVNDDILRHVTPQDLSVSVELPGGDPSEPPKPDPCPFRIGAPQAGPWELALPRERWDCAGNSVSLIFMSDLNYLPRRCISLNARTGTKVRLHFKNIAFGAALELHHGLHFRAEQHKTSPVEAVVSVRELLGDEASEDSLSVAEHELGRFSHIDGTGWASSSLSTDALVGQTGDLLLDVTGAAGRMFCLEATTR